MMHCGLLGQKLSHSYSPAIHSMLGDYEYKLYETEPENVETFLRKGDFDALNVTIPYKKCAAAICDELSETARAIGSVNTIVRRADGTLYGDNTDVYGFEELLRRAVFSPGAKKVLVLGSGITLATALTPRWCTRSKSSRRARSSASPAMGRTITPTSPATRTPSSS